MKRNLLFILTCFIVVLWITGCDSTKKDTMEAQENEVVQQSEMSELEPVNLVMYLIGSPSSGYASMLKELNSKLIKDIQATLTVKWIAWGDFSTQYPLVLASGEKIDLIYTASWLGYYDYAQRGAFLPLEELGPAYAPISFEKEPAEALAEASVSGHIYALPPNYSTYSTLGPLVRKDLREAYGIEPIESIEDYEVFLDHVVMENPELRPVALYATQTPVDGLYYYDMGLYPLSGDVATNCPFWIDPTDPDGRVINVTDLKILPEILAKSQSWYEKGFWTRNTLTLKDNMTMEKGEAASKIHLIDSWLSLSVSFPEWDYEYCNLVQPTYKLPYMQDGMAIPVSSDNPERALMLLELIRNNREYYDLMTYGIKGKDYLVTDGLYRPLDLEAFPPEFNCSWGFRDDAFRYTMEGEPDDYQETMAELESTAIENIYTGFKWDLTEINGPYQAVMDVMQQYYVPLKLGLIDPVEGLDQLKRLLEEAGIDQVQEEIQRQIDVYRQQNQ